MRSKARTFVFYHPEHGPFSMQQLRLGEARYGGSVARLRLLFALARRGHKVWVAGNVIASEHEGVRGVPAGRLSELDLRAADPAAVLVLNNWPREDDWIAFEPRRAPRTPVLLWAGNHFPLVWLDRLRERAIDRIVCVSRYHRDCYRLYRGFERIEFSYSGIDKDFLAPRRLGSEERVCSISVPRRSKGIDRLLAAWLLVHERRPRARLLVSGAAEMHEPQTRVGKTGILDADVEAEFPELFADPPRSLAAHGVELLGARDSGEVYATLAGATLAVVNPSHHSAETFCRSAVEAQAAGVPVVGAPCGALHEVIASGRTGLLYPNDSAEGLADAISRLLEDPGLLADMGRCGPAWADWFADYELIAPDWEAMTERAEADAPAPSEPHPIEDRLRELGYGQMHTRLRGALSPRLRSMIRQWIQ